MERDAAHSTSSSRRAFLARMSAHVTAQVTALTALTGCGRSAGPDEEATDLRPDADRHDRPPSPTKDAADTPTSDRRPPLPTEEPVVRVRVRRVRRRQMPIRIGEEGEWIELRAGEPAERGSPVVLHGPVIVQATTRGWSILDDRGFRPLVETGDQLELAAAERGPADVRRTVTVDGRGYPGIIRLVGTDAARLEHFDVVNHVPLEAYLPGVLERELYRHWHPRTHAAQAIAARSFACTERSYRGHRHYDLTNTTVSQVYGGAADSTRAIAAVRDTTGLVLSHHDALVPGYYSSCCGGLAATAVDAIGAHAFNDIPPLRGRPGMDLCTDAELFSWTIERTADEVVRRLSAFGARGDHPGLVHATRVRAITVAERNAHGRPRAFRVDVEPDGADPVVLDAATMRRALDHAAPGLPSPKPRLWSSNVEITVDGQAVRVAGFGHGHGAGMCQHGAEALARRGESVPTIVRWYYPGVEVVRAYEKVVD